MKQGETKIKMEQKCTMPLREWLQSYGGDLDAAVAATMQASDLDAALASHEMDPPPQSLMKAAGTADVPVGSLVTNEDGQVIGVFAGKDVVIHSSDLPMKPAASPAPARPANVMPAWMRGAGSPGRRVDV